MISLFKQPGSRIEEVEHLKGIRQTAGLNDKEVQQLLTLTKMIQSPSIHNVAYALSIARFSPELLAQYAAYAKKFETDSEPYNRYMRLVKLGKLIADLADPRGIVPKYKGLVEKLRSEKAKKHLKEKYGDEWGAGGL